MQDIVIEKKGLSEAERSQTMLQEAWEGRRQELEAMAEDVPAWPFDGAGKEFGVSG